MSRDAFFMKPDLVKQLKPEIIKNERKTKKNCLETTNMFAHVKVSTYYGPGHLMVTSVAGNQLLTKVVPFRKNLVLENYYTLNRKRFAPNKSTVCTATYTSIYYERKALQQ